MAGGHGSGLGAGPVRALQRDSHQCGRVQLQDRRGSQRALALLLLGRGRSSTMRTALIGKGRGLVPVQPTCVRQAPDPTASGSGPDKPAAALPRLRGEVEARSDLPRKRRRRDTPRGPVSPWFGSWAAWKAVMSATQVRLADTGAADVVARTFRARCQRRGQSRPSSCLTAQRTQRWVVPVVGRESGVVVSADGSDDLVAVRRLLSAARRRRACRRSR